MNDLAKINKLTSISVPEPAGDLRRAAFEEAVPGSIYVGRSLRNPTRKRVPSDQIFTPMPVGQELEDLVDDIILEATGDWKTIALLVHEAGMDCGSARHLTWEQVSDNTLCWQTRAGSFTIHQSTRLRSHLLTLRHTSKFVSPQSALLAEPWAQNEFLKSLANLTPAQRKIVQRFAIWPSIVERHHRLASQGLLPSQAFQAKRVDPMVRVKARLESLLFGRSNAGRLLAIHRFSPYRALTLDELNTLAQNLKGEWRLAIFIIFYLFISVGELCRLRWSRFDLDEGIATLAGRRTPIHSALLAILKEWPHPKTGKVVSFTSDTAMCSAAVSVFRKAGLMEAGVRLSSVRKASLQNLLALGLKLDRRGKVIMAGDFCGIEPTQAAQTTQLIKALTKLPDLAEPPNMPSNTDFKLIKPPFTKQSV